MSIGITEKEKNLKKEHTGCPDSRTSTIPGENITGDDRLNLKQKKRA